ncbi:MAG: hypothetical protein JSU86_15985 [Phycisphaerales bacterium]|nr:MAG: hypothetical protein JSU86_15985 [Phycisphaerales bacterium]
MAKIESHVAAGDRLLRARQYSQALREFQTARALIFRLQQPTFDVGAFVLKGYDLLPTNKIIETKLLEVSSRVADTIRPPVQDTEIKLVQDGPLADELEPFVRTGFRESVALEAVAEQASVQAVTLLQEYKPDAAIAVIQDALRDIGRSQIDESHKAALQLNLGVAHLQNGDTRRAAKHAKEATTGFTRLDDGVGVAQATHLQALVARQAGQVQEAKRLFESAAALLKKAGSATDSGPGPSAAAEAGATRSLRNVAQRSARVSTSSLSSRRLSKLSPIAQQHSNSVTYRIPGRAEGWGSVGRADPAHKRQLDKSWTVGVLIDDKTQQFIVGSGQVPKAAEIAATLYEPRITLESVQVSQIFLVDTASTTFYLTHLYAFVLAVKIGDCYHDLGQYELAERYYLQAADYTYLNTNVEAVAVWIRLANNVVEWGDSLYKQEDLPAAKAQYSRLVLDNGTVPAGSNLYTPASLKTATDQAKDLIQNIEARPLPVVNWEIAMTVLTAYARLQQIADNLDFYGLALSPIHTFEYLQSVARGFAQEAIQAEREFVNFKARQEGEEATRRDLESAIALAVAEAEAKRELFLSAQDDVQATDRALQLAVERHANAQQQRNDYAAASAAQIWAQAAATALGMGEDALYGVISELADRLARGETLEGPAGLLAAAVTLYGGRKTRQYELDKMDDNIAELAQAIVLAQEQQQSAQHRAAAAEIMWQAAAQKAQMAEASLDAFDAEFFTPESWEKMSNVMRSIARGYLYRAIRIAKLMERAYNFDNDTNLSVIKNQYGYALGNAPGESARLLGGDSLQVDIESFTYAAITSKTRKSSPIKDAISIASQFPAQFEEFKNTGLLSFETDMYEFDRLHPGFYAQRLEAVEVEIIGLLPPGGLNGTLSAGGVTAFRRKNGTLGKRVHQVDMMALSSFLTRIDAFLFSTETGVRGLFQGMGLGSTWQLHLPKRSNDFDFRRVFDINIVFYYTAKFDRNLRAQVLAAPARPDETRLLRTLQLRYDFPDAWYAFYKDGAAEIHLDRTRLPANQTNFQIQAAHFRVVTRDDVSPENIELRITGPDNTVQVLTSDAAGVVTSVGTPLSAIHGADPVGTWKLEVLSGPSLMDGAEMKLDRIYNVQLGMEYSFDLPAEVL